MGIYFNPGNGSFKSVVQSRIYVDKTGLIEELNNLVGTTERCVALSHARRFGKSQVAGMIDAYYSVGSDSRELFSPFEIAKAPDFERHLNKYNVIHVDVSSMLDNYDGDVSQRIWNIVYREMKDSFSNILEQFEPVSFVLNDIYVKSGRKFVIIIDEWDCVIRNLSERQDIVHKYLQFLHSLFKSEESKSYLALAYITGIMPIRKICDESALNNFNEYTMLSSKRFTRYFGFTTDEVKELCQKYDMNIDLVTEWYNGYLIDGIHMYNPNSVCKAMLRHSLESYFENTSSFETIKTMINLNMGGLKDDVLTMLKGNRVFVNVNTFKNDLSTIGSRDQALTALIHLGYLGYNAESKEAYIPNSEVSLAYNSIFDTGGWEEIAKRISRCGELLMATIRGEGDKVAEKLELSHDAYSSILDYNDKNAVNCAVTMAYFTASTYYNLIYDFPIGKGVVDIAMIPRNDANGMPPIIIDIKWKQDADTAIKYIKNCWCDGTLKGFGREVILVGISCDVDSLDKKYSCVIETMQL